MVVPAVSERTYSLMLVKPLTSGTLKDVQNEVALTLWKV